MNILAPLAGASLSRMSSEETPAEVEDEEDD